VTAPSSGIFLRIDDPPASRNVSGELTMSDGTNRPIDATMLQASMENAFGAMSFGLFALAAALAVSRLR